MQKLIVLSLRGGSVLGKFFLILVLAKYLEPSQLGLYGLIIATIYYVIFFLGLDFYTYSTRELIKSGGSGFGFILKSSLLVYFSTYLVFLPLLYFLFYLEILPWWTIFYFYMLVVFEHLSQESVRLLNALKFPVCSAIVLFVRNGSWAFFAAGFFYFYEEFRTLEFVLNAWLLGSLVSLFIGAIFVLRFEGLDWSLRADFSWIRKGLRTGLYFLIASLCVRGIMTFDRYMIEYINGLDFLGVYVFYFSVASVMLMMVDAGVSVFYYPDMISSYSNKDYVRYFDVVRRYTLEIFKFVFVFAVITVPVLYFLLEPFGMIYYQTSYYVYPFLLVSLAFYAASNVSHYALYAMGFDYIIIRIHFLSILLFFVLAFVFFRIGLGDAVLYSFSITMFFVFLSKYIARKTMEDTIKF